MTKLLLTCVILLLLNCSVASAQQPGEIGAYQGCKWVNGSWHTTALFCDYLDAKEWFMRQSGMAKVVDKSGLLVFAPFDFGQPKKETITVLPKTVPKINVGRPFKWITDPTSPTSRTRVIGGVP
jgi:hypothetical protein